VAVGHLSVRLSVTWLAGDGGLRTSVTACWLPRVACVLSQAAEAARIEAEEAAAAAAEVGLPQHGHSVPIAPHRHIPDLATIVRCVVAYLERSRSPSLMSAWKQVAALPGKLRQAAKDGHVENYEFVAEDGSKSMLMGLKSILEQGVPVDAVDDKGYTAMVSGHGPTCRYVC
jgi:hypothetical protein